MIAAESAPTDVITYEYPFNERIRTYLRLESLFRRLLELVAREVALDHHYALASLFEVMEVGMRSDLRAEVLRDLEKQKQLLSSYRDRPGIAQSVLDEVLQQLDESYGQLTSLTGKTGAILMENEWLMGIRSRINIPGGACAFDLPAYFAWQNESAERRRADLHRWISPLTPLAAAITLLLTLQRDSGVPQKVLASGGQYQQALPQGRAFQLLRLVIDPALGLIPEISGNRLMLSIRLMRKDDNDRLYASTEDASFELTLCA
jgi:cell division protein ZapD